MLATCMKWRLDNEVEEIASKGDLGMKSVEKFLDQQRSGKTYSLGTTDNEQREWCVQAWARAEERISATAQKRELTCDTLFFVFVLVFVFVFVLSFGFVSSFSYSGRTAICYIHVGKHFTNGQPGTSMQKYVSGAISVWRAVSYDPRSLPPFSFFSNVPFPPPPQRSSTRWRPSDFSWCPRTTRSCSSST